MHPQVSPSTKMILTMYIYVHCCAPVANCTKERSFSVLKKVKTNMRTTMTNNLTKIKLLFRYFTQAYCYWIFYSFLVWINKLNILAQKKLEEKNRLNILNSWCVVQYFSFYIVTLSGTCPREEDQLVCILACIIIIIDIYKSPKKL